MKTTHDSIFEYILLLLPKTFAQYCVSVRVEKPLKQQHLLLEREK